ncbi:glutaredoxin domain-containing protein [Moelleriella libera RCEF 2490]|uniref:Glutaredoxin domain-containing protein n=1 Tax=Moelleriella libera RCEF 2490 TaxID=1081109 RepID=A0A168C0S9_9HYPO|nr:glutaredoxin domain-containing protein [Moelleriella libera RCEF 2490]
MPSPRQMRLVCLASLVTLVVILFYSSSAGQSQDVNPIGDFYFRTMDGMKKASPPGQAIVNAQTGQQVGQIPADKDGDGDVDEDDKKVAAEMQVRLKLAEQKAKDNANSKGGLKPDSPSMIVGKGSSAGGQPQKVMGADSSSSSSSSKGDAAVAADKDHPEKSKVHAKEAKDQNDAVAELNSILKRSPVVIFSKTYCPHSKRAKGILLDKYIITPEPFVVELDEHPLGAALQNALAEKTGRKTVPNVLVNGVTIGGGDEVVALDDQNKLADKIRMLGNNRVQVTERFISGKKTT